MLLVTQHISRILQANKHQPDLFNESPSVLIFARLQNEQDLSHNLAFLYRPHHSITTRPLLLLGLMKLEID